MSLERSIPLVEREVRELVRERGVDPGRDEDQRVARLIEEVIDGYEARTQTSSLPRIEDPAGVKKIVLDRVAGLGPLQALLDDPDVEEIWINSPGRVFCAKEERHVLTNIVLDASEVRDLVERMLRTSGRRLDLSSPFVDAVLPDGSRLHVVIPDITRRDWAVNIRKFVVKAHTLDELVRLDSLDGRSAAFLTRAVGIGANVVVSGGTQTGKTTMLNCLGAAIPPGQRVVTCEEVFELQIPLPDVVAMQTRQVNLEGYGEIGLRRLIVEALRMRPDRIIVGEVRQQEAFDLLIALNSGLPGMTSIHANSATEAITKLLTLPLLAGENVSHAFVTPTVAASIDLIVHLTRRGSRRRVEEVVAVGNRVEAGVIESVPIFRRKASDLVWTGLRLPPTERFGAASALNEVLG
ncbi:MAG: CpaF family protein [Actinobacteria bacterium]|nr:CpaF family protein [Actinomycetota bacterium]